TGDDALDEVDVGFLRRRLVADLALRRRGAARAAAVLGARGRVEDDDVADVRRPEALADPVHEHALALDQGRDHRLARDAIRLYGKSPRDPGEAERGGD